jgi:hypothetical protein
VREHRVEAPAPRDAHERRGVGDQGQGGQRPLADDDRVHELDRHVLGVGGGAAVAEGQELAAAGEALRHGVAGAGDALGVLRKVESRLAALVERGLHDLGEHLRRRRSVHFVPFPMRTVDHTPAWA